MADLQTYRASPLERARTADLLRLLPKGRTSVLDIGAREGHFSRLLTEYFPSVTALDLERPRFDIPGVVTVAGDVTRLDFPDRSFDCIFCAEVLEHIPDVAQACREMIRVARHEIVVGVPFKQDIRIGRATCVACGKVNPPWGHVQSFDEARLLTLFDGLRPVAKSFIGSCREATNPISSGLLDLAGNPWGIYDEDLPCLHCGSRLRPPSPERSLGAKICSRLAHSLNAIQARFTRPHGTWIHLVLAKS